MYSGVMVSPPFEKMIAKHKVEKRGKKEREMTFCEDCKKYEQHWYEDKGYCEALRKPAEATDPACEKFEPLDGQTKLEV